MMWSWKQRNPIPLPQPRRNLQQFPKLQVEIEPDQVRFRCTIRKLLGFIVIHKGIKANPEKINAILNMEAPASIKYVQKLTGCMAALNRFLSRLGERGLPFFKLLKKQDKFKWSQEAADALEDLKQHLQSPPTLMAPLPGEELFLYIAATTHVVSTAIVVERKEEGQPTVSKDQSTS